ncbi:MAG TPA: DNA methyltransferase [Caulifigura sp.]|nr:DNA methyltransferase [Caulifigura sp.]
MSVALNTILGGDCVAGMNAQPAGSVDLVFADPPFNIGYDYDVYEDSLQTEGYLQWSREWISAVHRLLKPNGTFWLAIGDEYAAELKIEAQKIGFHCRSWVVWYYTFGVNCTSKFTRSHAHLFYFVKDRANFVFRSDDLENRIPSARQLVYNDNRANPKGRLPDDTWIIRPRDAAGRMNPDEEEFDLRPDGEADDTWVLRPQDLAEKAQARSDTWYFPRVAGTFKERAGFHGCQMPEQLLGRIIRACSEPGGVVADPFSGSGTTVAVAKKLGRSYLGFDLSPRYVELGLKRLESIGVGDPLEGSPEPLMSAPRTNEGKGRRKQRPSQPAKAAPETRTADFEAAAAGVRRAFESTYDGYSADRIVVDPTLNSAFIGACRAEGLAGTARDWNLLLFRLRKAGKLADLPTAKRTSIPWAGCDDYLFASEIAWQMMLEENRAASIDEILCDPDLAVQFDAIARRFAPGFEPLNYRWAALKLRKQAKFACSSVSRLEPRRLEDAGLIDELKPSKTPDIPAVYVVGVPQSKGMKSLYVGECVNLRNRLSKQFSRPLVREWKEAARREKLTGDLCVRYVKTSSDVGMLAYQSLYVTRLQPPLNLRDLRAKV